MFVYLESVHFGVWPHEFLPTLDCVHYWFCQLWVLPKHGSFYLGVSPPWWLSNWNRSTWESGYRTLCQYRIVSTTGSLNSGFCAFLVLSTWGSVHLGVCLLGINSLGILATWHSAHVGLCPLLVLSTLDSAHVFSVFFGVWPPLCLSTWILYTCKSVHMIFCQLRFVSGVGCNHSGFCSLSVLSIWDYVNTGLF